MYARKLSFLGAMALLVLAGCQTDSRLLAPADRALNSIPEEQCQADPTCGPGVDGTIHDGSGNGQLAEPLGDPSPGAAGIWLGNNVSGRSCYANYNGNVIDADQDWLDDQCEYELAKAFAPAVGMSPSDGCPGGEPYWAAKYFPNTQYGTGEFVRIAYMPGYYADCRSGGHKGDSEFIMVGIHHNPSTRHWEVKEMYFSAHAVIIEHFWEVYKIFGNSSEYITNPNQLEYPSGRSLSYPRVWVARGKHANYKSQSACNSGSVFNYDDCSNNVPAGRLRIYRHRNAGSRYVNFLSGCVASQNPLYYQNGRRECYYNSEKFKGWQVSGESGVTPYASFLHSVVFECYDYTYTFQGTCYYGGGPNPPSSTVMTGVIDGPKAVTAYQSYSWSSFVTGGTTPYRYEWWRRYNSSPTGTLVGTGSGWSGTVDRCEGFTLTMKVWSTDGQHKSYDHAVPSVTCPPPPLSVSITGPGTISQKGTYTYTTSVTGGQGPSFTWSERFCDDEGSTGCSPWSSQTNGTSSYTRVLSPDCTGTGTRTFQLQVVVRNPGGSEASDQVTTYLCNVPIA